MPTPEPAEIARTLTALGAALQNRSPTNPWYLGWLLMVGANYCLAKARPLLPGAPGTCPGKPTRCFVQLDAISLLTMPIAVPGPLDTSSILRSSGFRLPFIASCANTPGARRMHSHLSRPFSKGAPTAVTLTQSVQPRGESLGSFLKPVTARPVRRFPTSGDGPMLSSTIPNTTRANSFSSSEGGRVPPSHFMTWQLYSEALPVTAERL